MQFSRFMRGVKFIPSYMYCKFKIEKRTFVSVNFCKFSFFRSFVIAFFPFDNYPLIYLLPLQNRETKLQFYEIFCKDFSEP